MEPLGCHILFNLGRTVSLRLDPLTEVTELRLCDRSFKMHGFHCLLSQVYYFEGVGCSAPRVASTLTDRYELGAHGLFFKVRVSGLSSSYWLPSDKRCATNGSACVTLSNVSPNRTHIQRVPQPGHTCATPCSLCLRITPYPPYSLPTANKQASPAQVNRRVTHANQPLGTKNMLRHMRTGQPCLQITVYPFHGTKDVCSILFSIF